MMPDHAKPVAAAVGFRVKSGWATAVLLAGPLNSPRVIERRAIDLSDPAVSGSRQPYHAVMEAARKDAARIEKQLCRIVRDTTKTSVTDFLDAHRSAHDIHFAGIVVGSDIDPDKIKNDHIRAHALEGRLFRTAVEEALQSLGVPCLVIVERGAYTQAAAALQRSEDELRGAVTALGRTLGGPWRADEKTATLAAWMALSQPLN
jgi:hypothetical protein